MKTKDYLLLSLGTAIAGAFLYIVYRYLPLGIALVITGGCIAAVSFTKKEKIAFYTIALGTWLYPIGIVVTFIQNGWKLGILSIIIGFIAYRYAKHK